MMMKSVFWWRKPEYPEETTEPEEEAPCHAAPRSNILDNPYKVKVKVKEELNQGGAGSKRSLVKEELS